MKINFRQTVCNNGKHESLAKKEWEAEEDGFVTNETEAPANPLSLEICHVLRFFLSFLGLRTSSLLLWGFGEGGGDEVVVVTVA